MPPQTLAWAPLWATWQPPKDSRVERRYLKGTGGRRYNTAFLPNTFRRWPNANTGTHPRKPGLWLELSTSNRPHAHIRSISTPMKAWLSSLQINLVYSIYSLKCLLHLSDISKVLLRDVRGDLERLLFLQISKQEFFSWASWGNWVLSWRAPNSALNWSLLQVSKGITKCTNKFS